LNGRCWGDGRYLTHISSPSSFIFMTKIFTQE